MAATAVPWAATTSASLLLIEDVVLVVLDGLGVENVVNLVTARMLVGPGFYGLEHVTLDLDMVVAEGGMVEGVEDVIDNLIDRDSSVLPS